MKNIQDNNPGIDFLDAQSNVGAPYFLFTIQEGASAGGGVSCYFWFESPEQLIGSIKNQMDFWTWGNGCDEASVALAKIIDTYKSPTSLDDKLRSNLSEYTRRHAAVHLWAWGTFEDLCSGFDPFSIETRSEFREWCVGSGLITHTSISGDETPEVSLTEPIGEFELDLFMDYLGQTPT